MTYPDGPDDSRREAFGVRPFLWSQPLTVPVPTETDVATEGADPDPDAAAALRPFVITEGRVAGSELDVIQLETQVTVLPGAMATRLPPEKRAIVSLCIEPMSVAEISAKLRLHLGVTRLLVGDLRAAGQLEVHVLDDDFPDPETIMRVIRGLRSIS